MTLGEIAYRAFHGEICDTTDPWGPTRELRARWEHAAQAVVQAVAVGSPDTALPLRGHLGSTPWGEVDDH